MPLTLDHIVPWGRLAREYELMFALTPREMGGRILDCGGGPASFAAEMAARGVRAVAVDPIYAFSPAQIRERFEAIARPMIDHVRNTPDWWTWTFHRDPDDLLAHRRAALETFLADYQSGLAKGRYIVGELPALAFPDNSFALALC